MVYIVNLASEIEKDGVLLRTLSVSLIRNFSSGKIDLYVNCYLRHNIVRLVMPVKSNRVLICVVRTTLGTYSFVHSSTVS